MCQPEASIQKYIACFDDYVRATLQEFELPNAEEKFLVKKLIVTLYLKKGELVAFNQTGIDFESKVGENTMMEFINESCIATFTNAKEKKVRRGQKVIRVYEYFLQGPGEFIWREQQQEFVKKYYNQEVEKHLKKMKKCGNVLDVSYQLMSVGYPKF